MPAAATTTWNGSTSSDWDTASNWSNGVPTTAATVVIDGTVDITGGEPTAKVFENLFVAYSYTGSIGSAGTPLQIDCAEVSFDATSSSTTAYIDLLGVINLTPDVYVDGTNAGSALVISGDIDRMVVASTFTGTVTLGNSATFTADIQDLAMMAGAGTVDASNASNVAWQGSANVRITGGTVKVAENFGTSSTCTISAGTLIVSDWTATTGDTIVQLGGTVTWDAGDLSFSNSSVNGVNNLIILGGTFSMATNKNGYVSFANMYQFGGTVDLEASFANVEFTTKWERFGGSLTPPKQSIITATKLT